MESRFILVRLRVLAVECSVDNVIVADGSASMYFVSIQRKGLGMISVLPFCQLAFPLFLFFLCLFSRKIYIYSANYNLLGIFAPCVCSNPRPTVDLEFGSTLTRVLYHLEVIVITVCLEVALVSCVHEQ